MSPAVVCAEQSVVVREVTEIVRDPCCRPGYDLEMEEPPPMALT
jgi:hypothetical protein